MTMRKGTLERTLRPITENGSSYAPIPLPELLRSELTEYVSNRVCEQCGNGQITGRDEADDPLDVTTYLELLIDCCERKYIAWYRYSSRNGSEVLEIYGACKV